jgi:hypothetical protein
MPETLETPTGDGGVDPNRYTPEKEPCRRIYLHAFRGDRSKEGVQAFKDKLKAEQSGQGPGPTLTECLLYTGHVGISFEAKSPIYGFNPKISEGPVYAAIDALKNKKGYPGEVTDDTDAFNQTSQPVYTIEYVMPKSQYDEIKAEFDKERAKSEFDYSFPNGGGDCNCATWPARIGIPLPEGTGQMKEYIKAMQQAESPQFLGPCEDQ